ncbi:hypothetical protein [Thalassoroseus pseudoceratinae]|uniref:hypothetical protein n=1 Tax=Thalassoroseus pseudoceratinae TaxID=2713176 RepID=UPI0014219412|nr:hypothetical protein [Thalassoroseus pseudoceratinae]
MSWDVSVMKFSQPYASVEDIPDDETTSPIGTLSHVHAAVTRHFPGTDWNNAAWGIFDSPLGSIEFNLGKDDPATSMMLHVRASNEIVQPIVALCREEGWTALDCSTGEFLESTEDPTAGIDGWREYRDRAIGESAPDE